MIFTYSRTNDLSLAAAEIRQTNAVTSSRLMVDITINFIFSDKYFPMFKFAQNNIMIFRVETHRSYLDNYSAHTVFNVSMEYMSKDQNNSPHTD